jgi:hypothetical protein
MRSSRAVEGPHARLQCYELRREFPPLLQSAGGELPDPPLLVPAARDPSTALSLASRPTTPLRMTEQLSRQGIKDLTCTVKPYTMKGSSNRDNMQLVRFRHKGLRQLHEEGSYKGVPSAMATSCASFCSPLKPPRRWSSFAAFPLEASSAERRPERIMEPDRYRKLAADLLV